MNQDNALAGLGGQSAPQAHNGGCRFVLAEPIAHLAAGAQLCRHARACDSSGGSAYFLMKRDTAIPNPMAITIRRTAVRPNFRATPAPPYPPAIAATAIIRTSGQ